MRHIYTIFEFDVSLHKDTNWDSRSGKGYQDNFLSLILYDLIPFIIEDNLKMFYYRGLKEWNNEKGYLTDTCLTAQDKYKAYLDYFRIAY